MKIENSPVTSGYVMGEYKTIETSPGGVIEPTPQGEQTPVIPCASEPQIEENRNPLKQTAFKRGGKRIKRLFLRLVNRLAGAKRELTGEDLAELEEMERRKKLEKVLRNEAYIYKERIISVLNRWNICYRYPKSSRDITQPGGIKSVRFEKVCMSPDAFYWKVDTNHLPRGVTLLQLSQLELLTDISVNCGKRVNCTYSEKTGFWYIIERSSGILGIPSHVKISDMLSRFPASADGLSIPIGVTSNDRYIYRSLGRFYSMLVGGTIGAGKSNGLNAIICTLIYRNNPKRLKLILVDLKGGLEFSFYEGIPHLYPIEGVTDCGIVYDRTKVPDLLSWLLREGERRIEVIKKAGVKDIGRYNQHFHTGALPHILLVIDEYADLKLEPTLGKRSEDLLTNICQRFRAVGIHVIICTQVPKTEIVSTRIKGVLPAKLAFSCPNNVMSMSILDNGHASNLEPVGRAIFSWDEEIQLQTPYINDQQIKEIVDNAIKGIHAVSVKSHDVTPLEVMEYSLSQDNGFLSRDRLFNHFQTRGITQLELREWLAEWENQTFVIGSSVYQVIPGVGNRPRRLIAIENVEKETAINEPSKN